MTEAIAAIIAGIAGFIAGTYFGVFIMCLMHAAGKEDENNGSK